MNGATTGAVGSESRAPEGNAPVPVAGSFVPLRLQVRRVTREVVGRPMELAAIEQELRSALEGRLAAVAVEGEPGIGKTRLLVAAADQASAQGFLTASVAADEEIRGPFLLARSILAASSDAAVAGSAAAVALSRSLAALSGEDDPSLANLPPDAKLLRTYDLAALALREVAAARPTAIFVDDLQWADDDSLRLLRYVARADSASRLLLMMAIRPEELAFVTEGVTFLADLERFGVVRRLRLARFTQAESSTFLSELLGGKVDVRTATAMHGQSEGVPFILEEIVHTYRDAGMVQEIDGVWTLAKNADRLVPSAVRTLISRRASRLPDDTASLLATAAVLGRRFSLKDLQQVEVRVADREHETLELAERLAPAVAAGLLVEHPEDAAADYSFAHDQVREFASASIPAGRRRAIHEAIVELLMAGDPAPESLPLIVHHAKAAGNAFVCVHFTIEAVRNSLRAGAPEEVMRLVDVALPAASGPQDRLQLLLARDEALEMLRRTGDRLEGLSEITALSNALGDEALELDVKLRRAAALRQSDERELAASLAMEVREEATSRGDRATQLAATLELGQSLLGAPLGETFVPGAKESDLDGAGEAYRHAVDLARDLEDDASLADALRELAVVNQGKVRAWFIEQIMAGAHLEFLRASTSAPTLMDVLRTTPVAPFYMEAAELLEEALAIYERLEDRRGAMATIIALGYLNWGADIHLGSGAGRHIEEIRRLWSTMKAFTNESERALSEWQMLFGAHVFARAKVIPDLAISRGEDSHRQARIVGDRGLEFHSAGGTAMALLDIGDVDAARAWLARAAQAATDSPTPFRARQLELWQGVARAAAGEADEMVRHLERAIDLATEHGLLAARCEALARLALEGARLGEAVMDEGLLGIAESAASDTKHLAAHLRGHPPWSAQADAALARVALARGRPVEAASAARSALRALDEASHEDQSFEILAPAARALVEGGSEDEQAAITDKLRIVLALVAQRTFDGDIRAKWFRGPVGGELARITGPLAGNGAKQDVRGPSMDAADDALLRSLVEGHTDREIAEELGIDDTEVARRLGALYVRIGTSSRAGATAFALREVV